MILYIVFNIFRYNIYITDSACSTAHFLIQILLTQAELTMTTYKHKQTGSNWPD